MIGFGEDGGLERRGGGEYVFCEKIVIEKFDIFCRINIDGG